MMLSEDELPEEAKALSLYWMVDPTTGEKVKPRRWVYDPATGEFYRLISLQPSGPELQRIPYAERLEQRIAQERALSDEIANKRKFIIFCFAWMGLSYYWYVSAPLAFIFAFISGLAPLILLPGLIIGIVDDVLRLRNPNKLVDVGPKPIKKIDFSGFIDKQKEMGDAATRGSPLPLWPVPSSPEPEKKSKWDVGR